MSDPIRLREVGEAYCFGRSFCEWNITWDHMVHEGWRDLGDRPPGKPAEGTSVSRLWVLERGSKYRRSLQPGSPQSLLNPGYFTSANLHLRGLYPCNKYDEGAVLILSFQYPCACTGRAHPSLVKAALQNVPHPPKTLGFKRMSFQEPKAELQNALYFLMTKLWGLWQFSWW